MSERVYSSQRSCSSPSCPSSSAVSAERLWIPWEESSSMISSSDMLITDTRWRGKTQKTKKCIYLTYEHKCTQWGRGSLYIGNHDLQLEIENRHPRWMGFMHNLYMTHNTKYLSWSSTTATFPSFHYSMAGDQFTRTLDTVDTPQHEILLFYSIAQQFHGSKIR